VRTIKRDGYRFSHWPDNHRGLKHRVDITPPVFASYDTNTETVGSGKKRNS
jgi:hypothetical protein